MAENNAGTILSGKKLKWAHFAWWAGLILWTLSGGYDLWHSWWELGHPTSYSSSPSPVVFAAKLLLDLFYIILGIILFRTKSRDWMVILISMMFLRGISGSGIKWFWFGIITNSLGNFDVITTMSIYEYASNLGIAEGLASPMRFISQFIGMYAFLIFPNGKWIFPRVRWLIIVWSILFFLPFFQSLIPSVVTPLVQLYINNFNYFVFLGIIAGLQILQYRKMPNSVQKQQIKWIVISFAATVLVSAIASAVWYWVFFYMREMKDLADGFLIFTSLIFNFFFAFAFSISIFRYRLWDTEILINRALVYSLLTGSLGLLGILSTAILNFFLKQALGETQSVWAVVISALPMAAAFNPLRSRLQTWVDHFFKPEEIDFEHHFLEFRADVRDMLGTERIIEIVARQVKKQLNVEFARVYLLDINGCLVSPLPTSEGCDAQFSTDEDILGKLMDGKLVVDDDGDPYSLLVPLVVTRPRFPDFLGVLVLGRRLSGLGYSTQILDSLKILGANAGEAIYLSQLSAQSKQTVFA